MGDDKTKNLKPNEVEMPVKVCPVGKPYNFVFRTPPKKDVSILYVSADGDEDSAWTADHPPIPYKEGEPKQFHDWKVKVTVEYRTLTQRDRKREGFKPVSFGHQGKRAVKGSSKLIDMEPHDVGFGVFTKPEKGEKEKKFTTQFLAPQAVGVYRFRAVFPTKNKAKKDTFIQDLHVVPKRYRTIASVLKEKDRQAVARRIAVLAGVYAVFPAYNTATDDDEYERSANPAHYKTEGPWKQGTWKQYGYPYKQGDATSCTSVNPKVMGKVPLSSGKPKKVSGEKGWWAFGADPWFDWDPPKIRNPNPGWVYCEEGYLPSVGDTYIVSNVPPENKWPTAPETNRPQYSTGHVGIVVHVPKGGNGLWVTADGGQTGADNKTDQVAILIPRWGLMGKHLPTDRALVAGFPALTKKDEFWLTNCPWLSQTQNSWQKPKIDIKGWPSQTAHGPETGKTIAGILTYKKAPSVSKTCNPRALVGFVNVDDEQLKFGDPVEKSPKGADDETAQGDDEVTYKGLDDKTLEDMVKKVELLKLRVDGIMERYATGVKPFLTDEEEKELEEKKTQKKES